MFLTLAWVLGVVVLALAAYFLLWPVPIEPAAWTAPAAPRYHGVDAVNNGLGNAKQATTGSGTRRARRPSWSRCAGRPNT